MAAISQAHGLNTNLVHRWRRNQAGAQAPAVPGAVGEFMALALPAAALSEQASAAPSALLAAGDPCRTAPRCGERHNHLAAGRRSRVRCVAAGMAQVGAPVIRIEVVWLATVALDMRCGTDTALARVVRCSARPVHTTPNCSPTQEPTA